MVLTVIDYEDILFHDDCLWSTDIDTRIIILALQKLITITIVFHKSYQCAIMSEVT